MPTFKYYPTRSVTPANIHKLRAWCEHELYTDAVTQSDAWPEVDSRSLTTLGGKTKTIKLSERLRHEITIGDIDIMQYPYWVEFIRSVNCGEKFCVNPCDIPGFIFPVDYEGVTMEGPQMSRNNAHNWSLSMTLYYCLRTI